MKVKLTSRKFWVAILSIIVSITLMFKEVGGTVGIVTGIIGVVASTISYIIAECMIDIERAKVSLAETEMIIETLKKEGE